MALKYTGRADVLIINNKRYAQPKTYAKEPHMYDGTLDKPIPGLTKEQATKLVEVSKLHSFEENGEDLEEKLTQPTTNSVLADEPATGSKK